MIDFIYDTFRLYLAKNHQYVKRYIVNSKEKAYELIDQVQDDYDEYLLIGHINILNEDDVIEKKEIEHIDKPKKKRRIK